MHKRLLWAIVLASSGAKGVSAEEATPWWDRQKIRFGWGQWTRTYNAKSGMMPFEQLMENLARVGMTVYKGNVPGWDREQARIAHKHNIRYFGAACMSQLPDYAKDAPPAVNTKGQRAHNCPLHRPLYEAWLLKPALEAAKSGVVDGYHIDCEPYDGKGKQIICYCDRCFGGFLAKHERRVRLAESQRFKWIQNQGLAEEYFDYMRGETTEMFRGIAEEIRKVKQDFVFSAYGGFDYNDRSMERYYWRIYGMALGLNAPGAPFIALDHRHYWDDHTRPWWRSSYAFHRGLGFRHIAGTWDNSLFGGRPASDVGAAQWMYDAAINTDGYWMWHAQELGPDVWRAFAIADRRIRGTERKVGKYLLRGCRDIHFVTLVEWSGRPEFDRTIIQAAYHLGEEHVVHVNNVDTDRPARVRLRLPRLREGRQWIVRDPISDLHYTPDGRSAVWDAATLLKGIVVPLEKRSEVFVLLSPAPDGFQADPSSMVASAETRTMPDPPAMKTPEQSSREGGGTNRLVYLATDLLDFDGPTAWTIGNSIYGIDADGGNKQRLRAVRGHLWSPSWSPDGRHIAFSHYGGGRGQIFVMNADGSGVRNLSSNAYCDRSPVWSPDGTKIAFVSDRDGDWEIYVASLDNGRQTRLTESAGLDANPVWAPDGRRLAFESERSGVDTDIYVMNADGSEQRIAIEQAGNVEEPAWSPDGKRIAAVGISHPWRGRLLTKEIGSSVPPRQLMRQPYVGSVRWSPDGRLIAGVFRGPQETDGAGIFTIRPDGAGRAFLLRVDGIRPHPGGGRRKRASWYSSGNASPRWVVKTFGSVCWSSDSKQIAFSADISPEGAFHIYTIPAQGGKPTRLDGTASAWLQDVMWCPR